MSLDPLASLLDGLVTRSKQLDVRGLEARLMVRRGIFIDEVLLSVSRGVLLVYPHGRACLAFDGNFPVLCRKAFAVHLRERGCLAFEGSLMWLSPYVVVGFVVVVW